MEGALCKQPDPIWLKSALALAPHAPDLQLIETLLWDGRCLPRWPLHMARLTESAAALGWDAPDPAAVRARIAAAGLQDAPARLRLTLDAAGHLQLTVAALPAVSGPWRLALAPQRLCSDDPWLQIKSTRRGLYDRMRAALPAEVDELIFLNERGEACEGTITTLFFDRGEGMRTPPLSSGLLPGVLRREIGCPEEVLLPKDFGHVTLWVGNALRGLIPARFVDIAPDGLQSEKI